MKRFFILASIIFSTSHFLFGQITLETTYQNANSFGGTNIQFTIAEIDSGIYKYLLVDYNTSSFTLYNLNHSIYQTVNIPVIWSTNARYSIYYVTRTLFDCDSSNIEYLLNKNCSPSPCFVGGNVEVYRDDGTSIFYSDSAQAMFCFNCPTIFKYPIINTPNGTKMILEYRGSEVAKVFSICGKLPTSIASPNSKVTSNVYPNPTNQNLKIEYNLNGDNKGTIHIFDMNGKKIEELKIDNTFSTIILDISHYNSGTYIYKLITDSGKTTNNKFIVVK